MRESADLFTEPKEPPPPRVVFEPGEAPLKNAQHEEFAQGVAAGLGQHEAYIAAGFEPNPPNASRLKARPLIDARINYLRREFNNTAVGNGRLKLQWLQKQYIGIVTADPVRDRDRLAKIASRFEIDAEGNVKYQVDRAGALDSLTRTVGGFITRAELTGANGSPLAEPPSTAHRARALLAFLHETKFAAGCEDGSAATSAAASTAAAAVADIDMPAPAPEAVTPFDQATRALRAVGDAARVVVRHGDRALATSLAQRLRGLADVVEQQAARAAVASAEAQHAEDEGR